MAEPLWGHRTNHAIEGYYRLDPRLLWHRITHRLFGRRRGCSCTTCFHHPRRRVPASEFYRDRMSLAQVEREVRELRIELRDLRRERAD